MAQVGLHGLAGLVLGPYLLRGLGTNREAKRALMFGFVMGNLVPDLDYLAVVAVYPLDDAMAMHLHRGFTHSLLAAVALAVGCWWVAHLMRHDAIRQLGYGLALGVVTHFTTDIFIWFSPVDIFWPASVFGIIPPLDLWSWFTTPPIVGRLLGAAEFGAFAGYYDHLARLAVAYGTDREMVRPAQRMAQACLLSWAILTALSFDVPEDVFTIYLYVPMGIIFMPAIFYVTWQMEATIELLSDQSPPRL